jgi:hypothetical protein
MKWFERAEIRWMLILTLVGAWVIRAVWFSAQFVDLGLSIIGLILVVIVIAHYLTSATNPLLLWDESTATLAVIRGWTVEVSSARLMGSVPIGIDLSHSAVKVLRAVYSRYMDGPSSELNFFVCRPLGNSSTIVGMIVKRKALRLLDGVTRSESLRKQVMSDAAILESAMRAAYPHMPITKAGMNEVLMTVTGGFDSAI